MRDFKLSEWLKDKSQKVVDKDLNPVTIFFFPLGTAKAVVKQYGAKITGSVSDDEMVGVYKAIIKGFSCNPTICETWKGMLFFQD